MEQPIIDPVPEMPPRETKLLENYFLGLPLYLCAKAAKYRAKTKKGLRDITNKVVRKYDSQAGKDEISARAGGHVANWWRDLQWAKRRARAKKDLKTFVATLKMQGEAIGVLKAREFEGEVGATIIVQSGEVQEVKADKKQARVVSIASAE